MQLFPPGSMQSYEEQLESVINNPERLAALNKTFLLDSPPEIAFDRVTDLVRRLLNAPISLVSLVAEDHQYFKSTQGLPEPVADLRTTPLSHSFCKHTITVDQSLAVTDTRTDEIVREVQSINDFGIHTYAGVPLYSPDNQALGTLCALGFEPRTWQDSEIEILENLAEIVMTEIALRLEVEKQRELKAQLADSEKRYRSMINEIHEAVIKINMDGIITFVNPAWVHLLGFSPEATTGQSINKFLDRDPIYGSPFNALLAHASSDKVYTAAINSRYKNMKWIEFRMKLIQNESNPHLVGLLTDVTNSYRIEAEKEARQVAESHLKLKNALLNNMTHEFRTPLSAIMSCSEILEEEVTPDQKQFATMILEGGKRLLTTMETILLYAQAESGNLIPSVSSFDIVALIGDVISVFPNPKIPVVFHSPESILIDSDRSLCSHIVRCLLDNALKFTPDGQVEIKTTSSPDRLSIEIKDTGIGIPEENLAHIFLPFDQVSDGNARLHDGVGLGLPLAKVLTDILGGSLDIKSTLKEGTSVRIELPRS